MRAPDDFPKFTHHGGCPNRRAVLQDNYDIREGKKPGAVNFGPDGGFGRAQFRIPEFDYAFIRRMFPKLAAKSSAERHEGWLEFARSPLSEPYRVDRKVRKGGREIVRAAASPVADSVAQAIIKG